MDTKIPIFIISHDRLTVLKYTIESFKQIKTPYTIIIHDNCSKYQPTLDYLHLLDQEDNISVVFSKYNDLNGVSKTIKEYFKKNPESKYYIVTDPDISLYQINGDILELYKHLLNINPSITAVGPMLEIHDIPDYYPLKALAIKKHTDQFWHKTPIPIKWNNTTVHIQYSPIDTTFAMYRQGFNFKNYNRGIRVYSPYSAQHLDWYIDPNNLTDDQKYYIQNSNSISHWGGTWLKKSQK